MLGDYESQFLLEPYYDWLRRNGGYDYSKKGYLSNHTNGRVEQIIELSGGN